MSHTGKPSHEMGFESLANRFQESFAFEENKPDFKEIDLSPPTVSRNAFSAGGATTTTASTTITAPSTSGSGGAMQHSKNPFGKRSNGPATTPEKLGSTAGMRNMKPGHRRSNSTGAPLVYSGTGSYFNNSSSSSTSTSSTTTTTNNSGGSCTGGGSGGGSGSGSAVSSPNTKSYSSGNICPSGKVLKSNMGSRGSNRTEILGLGTGNYGHGSIIKGGSGGGKVDCNVGGNLQSVGELAMVKRAMLSSDQEEVKEAGNELYKRGNFAEALSLYDHAIAISPENVACRSNRAAALTMLGRLGEAVRECEEAVRLNPGYRRAHQRLASLYLRLGQVENARLHLLYGQQTDTSELQKLHSLEKHINRCSYARTIGDWKGALRECDAAMSTGAVSSPQIIALKAEAFLKLRQLEDADSSLYELPKIEPYPPTCSQVKFFGMLSEAYVLYIRAQVDMALGRFETAATAAEKAGSIDSSNVEVALLLNNIKLVARARARGKELFDSGRFSEACSAYGDGLKLNLSNAVLHCNRAVCWSKLGLWEQSVEDCNQALKIQPNYTKALLRRAASNAKLEKWAAAVRDYEALKKELPGDNDVAESLSRAQESLKRSSQGVAFGLDHTRASVI